ncbi:cell wall synthase accessory phosphoprotein MacP [Streptococcus sp. H31]|uniref:cell wall synthase accessory phosphoprotein MacP n=1 Tax=Streptococcus huangxiaojuni TaxID=3237239 RepID=UPI0034A2B295
MGKPLLTDEIIEAANRDRRLSEDSADDFATKVLDKQLIKDDLLQERREERIVKSRRIENAKRGEFQSKLNKIFIVLVILLAILIYAVFYL